MKVRTQALFLPSVATASPLASRSLNRDFIRNPKAVSLTGPPDQYTLRDASSIKSLEIVSKHYPELRDLVDEGSLVVYERPPDYVERRDDGYVEPELIFIVGTCHISLKSAAEVERVIDSVKPENVVVELCRSRASILFQADSKGSNPFVLSGEGFLDSLARAIRLGGPLALGFRILMASLARKIGSSFEAATGVEMRSAQKAADRINAQIVLGDRPVEITLKRAINSLGFRKRMKLLAAVSSGIFMSQSEVDYKTDSIRDRLDNIDEDLMSTWMKALTDEFPELASPLLHERDLFLAWSLKRSQAVNRTKRVVGVVGKGHLRGTYYALQNDKGDLRFKDLVFDREAERSNLEKAKALTKRLTVDIVIGGACYFVWTSVFHS